MRRRRKLLQIARTLWKKIQAAQSAPPGALTFDLVFADPQPWNLGEGWLGAFADVARLGSVVRVTPKRHGHIWQSLAQSHSDGVIAIGFDHHTPFLHDTEDKQAWWKKLGKPLIPIFYERIVGTPYSWNEERSQRASHLAHFIVYNCGSDEEFVAGLGKPHLWQPFGVDDTVFKNQTAYVNRLKRAFFDGKTMVTEVAGAYQGREKFLSGFVDFPLLDRLPYDSRLSGSRLGERYNGYQVVLNPPSIYSGHTCRVWEALACGCLLFTPRPMTKKEEELFSDGSHVIYLDLENPAAIQEQMNFYLQQAAGQQAGQLIAEAGNQLVCEKHTLRCRLRELISHFKTVI